MVQLTLTIVDVASSLVPVEVGEFLHGGLDLVEVDVGMWSCCWNSSSISTLVIQCRLAVSNSLKMSRKSFSFLLTRLPLTVDSVWT